jgi:hypothetical protein
MYIIEEIVKKKPFLQESLSKGIINYAALAEILKVDVEKYLRKEVKLSAINMSLRRLAEKLERNSINNLKFDDETDITLRSNLFEVIIKRNKYTEEKRKKIYLRLQNKDFYSTTYGIEQICIISNHKFKDEILSVFDDEDIIAIFDKLGGITINFSNDLVEEPGFFYLMTKSLAWEGVSIVELISTLTEMTFILHDEDLILSFNSLKKIIDENKI